tara:strand:- start:734 stop:2143 length:1410 start_codon:yes stop_codon:yes gene_type:complete
MAVKFSQFTTENNAANITHIVGYFGTTNAQIPTANLDTTYTLESSASGDNVILTLDGTKPGGTATDDTITITKGTGITFSSITAAGFTISASGAVTTVSAIAPGSPSTGNPLVVTPTTGDVEIKSMAFAGGSNVGHVPSAAAASAGQYLDYTGNWSAPAGAFTGFTVGGDSGSQTVANGDTLQLTGGTNIGTVVTSGGATTDIVTINLEGTIFDGVPNYGSTINIAPTDNFELKAGTQFGEATTTVVGSGVYTTGDSGSDLISLDQAADLKITVVNPGSGNKFYVDGAQQSTVVLPRGFTYEFNQLDSSNSSPLQHPLFFSTTSDGTHGGGTAYTTGVKCYGNGAPVSFTDYHTNFTSYTSQRSIRIRITQNTPTLYYYCYNHSGMGGPIAYGAASGLATRTVDQTTISNSTTGTITLSVTPTSEAYTDMYVSGVYQNKSVYSLSSNTITLDGGAYFPNGSIVEVVSIT